MRIGILSRTPLNPLIENANPFDSQCDINLAFCQELSCKTIKMLNHVFRSGIDVNNVIETAESFNETSKVEERNGQLSLMTLHMHR